MLDDVSDLGDFESCTSSIRDDHAENELGESPFFRNRSSSDSAAMGNKSSSATKAKGRLVFNPRPGTETQQHQEPNHSPPAIVQSELPNSSPSSTRQQTTEEETGEEEQQIISKLAKTVIGKSTTCETLFADVDEPEEIEDPSSYKDVAHHHTWTCDDNLLIVSETSDSINVPDLPLDSYAATEPCSLREIPDIENAETPSLSSGFEQPTSANFEFDEDTSPYATELCSKSHEIVGFSTKNNNLRLTRKHFPSIRKKSACIETSAHHRLGEKKLEYLSLEIPDLILHYIVASRIHICKTYAEKKKSVSFTLYLLELKYQFSIYNTFNNYCTPVILS